MISTKSQSSHRIASGSVWTTARRWRSWFSTVWPGSEVGFRGADAEGFSEHQRGGLKGERGSGGSALGAPYLRPNPPGRASDVHHPRVGSSIIGAEGQPRVRQRTISPREGDADAPGLGLIRPAQEAVECFFATMRTRPCGNDV
jgi:hypothetical protein